MGRKKEKGKMMMRTRMNQGAGGILDARGTLDALGEYVIAGVCQSCGYFAVVSFNIFALKTGIVIKMMMTRTK